MSDVMAKSPLSSLKPGAITVVMPNRNHGHYIAAALEAVCTQSHRPDRVVVVDDRSTDDSRDIVARLMDRFPVIERVENPSARGTVRNLNDWLFRIDTEYVLFAGADDLIFPDFLKRTAGLLDAHPAAPFATSASAEMDAAGRPLPLPRAVPSNATCFLSPGEVLDRLMAHGAFGAGNTTLYRTALLRGAGGFPAEFQAFCDGYLLQSMALERGCIYIPETLGSWRRQAGGYAGTMAQSRERLLEVGALVEGRMRGADRAVFPDAYVRKFGRRWRYAAALGLYRARLPAEGARAAGLGRLEGAVLGTVCRVLGARWIARYLLVRLLPGDVPLVLRRKLGIDGR
jgi:glycosyltransferase involved in cell wall biosynthesis